MAKVLRLIWCLINFRSAQCTRLWFLKKTRSFFCTTCIVHAMNLGVCGGKPVTNKMPSINLVWGHWNLSSFFYFWLFRTEVAVINSKAVAVSILTSYMYSFKNLMKLAIYTISKDDSYKSPLFERKKSSWNCWENVAHFALLVTLIMILHYLNLSVSLISTTAKLVWLCDQMKN